MRIHTKIIQFFIVILGLSGCFALAFNQLYLLANIQSLGIVPIPLVFDAPQGYEFWSNTYQYNIQTNIEKFNDLKLTKQIYQSFPRHSIVHNTALIPLGMLPLFKNEYNQQIMNKIFCQSLLWKHFIPRELHPNEKLIHFNLKIYSKKNEFWEYNISCL